MKHLTLLGLSLLFLIGWFVVDVSAETSTVIESRFDSDSEGWGEVGDGSGPFWDAIGGNPDGHIHINDNQNSTTWYFAAPAAFLGDVSAAYGSTLSFDLRQSNTSGQYASTQDVLLMGAGMTLYYNTHVHPTTEWTPYTITLLPEAGWRHAETHVEVTSAELQAVLGALDALHIRGEFRSGGDTGYLDNVVLALTPPTQTPITLTVNTTDDLNDTVCDAIHCSLREAIHTANANLGHDTILFDQAIVTPTIAISGTLPTITDTLMLDGALNDGRIVLDGTLSTGSGFTLHSYDSIIRNFVIHSFAADGITLRGYGNTISDNILGLDASGTVDLGNAGYGIYVLRSNGNVIRDNLISGNQAAGVRLESADSRNNLIANNYIGTDESGTIDLGNTTNGIVLFGATHNTIQNNLLSGNNDNGLLIAEASADFNVVVSNTIGTDVTGSADLGNSESGIRIRTGASSNQIGDASGNGNLISGNNQYGIYIESDSSDANMIQGNKIGTDQTGNTALRNNRTGIYISQADKTQIGGTAGTTIGGACTGACNLISGNGSSTSYRGIETVNNANATIIEANYIGTNISGTLALPNTNYGIFIDSSSNGTIGGFGAARNVVSGNACHGMRIEGSGHVVENNYVGVGSDGVTSLGNGCSGIRVDASNSTFSENVLSANTSHGLWGQGNEDNNIYSDNLIGVGADGTTALGNGLSGIHIDGNNSNWTSDHQIDGNTIANNGEYGVSTGGTRVQLLNITTNDIYSNTLDGVRFGHSSIGSGNTVGAGNVIRDNGGNGISVATTQRQTISGSAIFDNGSLSIDLGEDGATANDPDDLDTGANLLQNFPTLIDAASQGGSSYVAASLNTVSNTVVTLDFYSSTTCDGTIEQYLGDTTALTDASGNVTVTQAFGVFAPVGDYILGTATDADGNTSELSDCLQIAPATGVLQGTVLSSTSRMTHTAPFSPTVTLYRDVGTSAEPLWFLVGHQPLATSNFQFNNLSTGDYALFAQDDSNHFAPEYFDNADSFATVTIIAVTNGMTTTLLTPIELDAGGIITGLVTAEDSGLPLANIQVTALFDNAGTWENFASTHTDSDGQYALTNLPSGDFRLFYFDQNGVYSSEYFDDSAEFDLATAVLVTRSVIISNINAVLDILNPIVITETDPNATVPCTVQILDGGQIRIRRHRSHPSCQVTITTPVGLVACTNGETPSNVMLDAEANSYPMVETSVGSGSYTTGLITIASSWGSDRDVMLSIDWDCGNSSGSVDIGNFQLYDPSGFITNANTGEPIEGASVTLFKVPNWRARTHPADNGANTCESNLSKPAGAAWSQPAPTERGVLAAPLPSQIDPQLTTQLTNSDGYYGWDVAAGCWYVVVVADGYEPLVSPVVGVPTEVTDLDLQLQPLPPTSIQLGSAAVEAQPIAVWIVVLLLVTTVVAWKRHEERG